MNDRTSGATEAGYTTDEMMTVATSRELKDGVVCFVGIGLPGEATNLARATHAPNCVLIESGTIGAKPDVLPLSIGDGVLAEHADSVVSVPEIFNYWLQTGRVDVGFLGAAQMDRYGNINTTVVGPYESPKVRFPGAGGAPEIAASAREVIVILRQKPPRIRRGTRLRHLRRSLPRRRVAQGARLPGRRGYDGRYGPRNFEAGPGDQRAHAERPAPWSYGRAGQGGDGVGVARGRRPRGDRPAHRRRATHSTRPSREDRGREKEDLRRMRYSTHDVTPSQLGNGTGRQRAERSDR